MTAWIGLQHALCSEQQLGSRALIHPHLWQARPAASAVALLLPPVLLCCSIHCSQCSDQACLHLSLSDPACCGIRLQVPICSCAPALPCRLGLLASMPCTSALLPRAAAEPAALLPPGSTLYHCWDHAGWHFCPQHSFSDKDIMHRNRSSGKHADMWRYANKRIWWWWSACGTAKPASRACRASVRAVSC